MLNPRSIESATRNPQCEALLIDGTGERGAGRLALRVRPTTNDHVRAEWLALWWRDGRRRFGVIGRYPALSLRAARDRFAEDWRPAIEAGRDPRLAKRIDAARGTVADLFEGYIGSMKSAGRRSWQQVERALLTGKGCAAKRLGRDTKASDVTPEMISDYLKGVYSRGSHVAADRYRAHLHAAFQWGAGSTHDYTRVDHGAPVVQFGLRVNPVAVVPRDTSANKARQRALSVKEVGALWHALAGSGFGLSTGPAIRLLLCTGQRVLDVLRAEGADFDLTAKLWTIPAHKRKVNEHDHVVVLSPAAVSVVRELVKIRGKDLLFPHAKKAGEHVPNQTINRALARWQARADGVEPFQARDLRRTWKTLAGEAGLSKEIRDRIQGHALTDVSSRHYDRYEYLREKHAAMKVWSAWMARHIVGRLRKMNAR